MLQAFLSQEDTTGDNVESLIKKHEDFDKAIASQQEKLNNLDTLARQLVQAGHYAAPQITAKRDQTFERWDQLKAALIEKPSNLGTAQTLQQFSQDVDEVAEKFQVAQEETYKNPTNIQQKLQEQQSTLKRDVVESSIGDKEPHVRSADFGRDLSSVQLLQNKQDTFDNGLNTSEDSADVRGKTLNKAITVHQLLRNIDEEESWIKEKKLINSGNHHAKNIGTRTEHASTVTVPSKLQLQQRQIPAQQQLQKLSRKCRRMQLQLHFLFSSSLLFYCPYCSVARTFCSSMRVLKQILSFPNVGENMATVQGLLKKHDMFEVGLQMHQQRID
ncbi:hypothetical protein niasHS_004806 [Heterodera schachtii]|uniref:Uncharacterized protein n=1 Tax=Heterodera schachtii TaxID=97005 RepID=A0ABD2JU09_HETSC